MILIKKIGGITMLPSLAGPSPLQASDILALRYSLLQYQQKPKEDPTKFFPFGASTSILQGKTPNWGMTV